MKKLTLNWLKKHKACKKAVIAFKESGMTDLSKILDTLIKSNSKEKLEWANWLIVQIMNKKQKVQYAVFAVELVIDIFEEKYPNDDRPRKAIEAAKKYLNNQSQKNRAAAAYAAARAAAAYTDAAAAAAYAADAAAAYAADAAAYAADAAAAYTAADAAYTAAYAYAAADAADAAAYVDAANHNKILITILKNGIKILNE